MSDIYDIDGHPPQHHMRGIVMMLLSATCWVIMNAMIKEISNDYHPAQILFFRNIVILPVVIPFLIAAGGLGLLATKKPMSHLARSFCGLVSMTCLIIAVARMPLSDVIAITYAAPLFITLLGALVLGEHVGVRRWLAVAVGFLGVLVMTDPTGNFRWEALIMLLGAFAFSLTVVIARTLSRTEPSAVIVFYFALLSVFVSTCFLPWVWQDPVSIRDWILLVGAGGMAALTQLTLVAGIRAAPISVTAPFDYFSLVMAAGIDIVIWSVFPSMTTIVGALTIVAAGLYIALREARQERKQAAVTPPS
ncbi:MAG: DMT family transporter [Rhodospirillales bacterium]